MTYHDGSAFNADDIVCSFERAPNVPNSPSSFGTYTKGKTVVKVDDFTIQYGMPNQSSEDAPFPSCPEAAGSKTSSATVRLAAVSRIDEDDFRRIGLG